MDLIRREDVDRFLVKEVYYQYMGRAMRRADYLQIVRKKIADEVPSISLNTLRDEIYNDAVAHGLWDYPQYNRTRCEMLDYVRAACVECIREELMEAMESVDKPEQFEEELADAFITILSTFGHLGIDADAVVRGKMAINKERPWKHGKEEKV